MLSRVAAAALLLLPLAVLSPSAADPDVRRGGTSTVYDGPRPGYGLRAATNAHGDTAYAWECRFNWRELGSREWSVCLRIQKASGSLSPVAVMAPHREGRGIDSDSGDVGFEVVLADEGVATVAWLSEQGGKVSLLARQWAPRTGRGPLLTLARPEQRTSVPHSFIETALDATGAVTVAWVEGDGGTTYQPVARVISAEGTVSARMPIAPASPGGMTLHAVGSTGFVWMDGHGTIWYRSWRADGELGTPLEVGTGQVFDTGISPAGNVVVGYRHFYDPHGRWDSYARLIGHDGTLGDLIVLDNNSIHRVAVNDAGRIFYFSTWRGQTGVETYAPDGTSTPYAVVTDQNSDISYINSLDPVVTATDDVIVSWTGPGGGEYDRRIYTGRISADGATVDPPRTVVTARALDDPAFDLQHYTWRSPDGRLRMAWHRSIDNGIEAGSSIQVKRLSVR